MNDPNNALADQNNQPAAPPVLVTGTGGLQSVLQVADLSAAAAAAAAVDDASHGDVAAFLTNMTDLN